MESVRDYRAMASLCRVRATFDPANALRWIARADRWEALAEAEIDERYRECNVGREEFVA
jgi:hypothetical protein